MLTQAIKEWLQRLFAWWPWKQTTPTEQRVTSTVTRGFTSEKTTWSVNEGSNVSASMLPSPSTVEEWPDRVVLPPPETSVQASLFLPAQGAGANKEPVGDPSQTVLNSQQRLEFLRYLVQRGIVNEGFEEKKSDI